MTVSESIHPEVVSNFIQVLKEATGRHWEVEIIKGAMGETIADKEEAVLAQKQKDVMEYPLVRAIMNEFKGAKIESLIRRTSETKEDSKETTNDLIFDEENE